VTEIYDSKKLAFPLLKYLKSYNEYCITPIMSYTSLQLTKWVQLKNMDWVNIKESYWKNNEDHLDQMLKIKMSLFPFLEFELWRNFRVQLAKQNITKQLYWIGEVEICIANNMLEQQKGRAILKVPLETKFSRCKRYENLSEILNIA